MADERGLFVRRPGNRLKGLLNVKVSAFKLRHETTRGEKSLNMISDPADGFKVGSNGRERAISCAVFAAGR